MWGRKHLEAPIKKPSHGLLAAFSCRKRLRSHAGRSDHCEAANHLIPSRFYVSGICLAVRKAGGGGPWNENLLFSSFPLSMLVDGITPAQMCSRDKPGCQLARKGGCICQANIKTFVLLEGICGMGWKCSMGNGSNATLQLTPSLELFVYFQSRDLHRIPASPCISQNLLCSIIPVLGWSGRSFLLP